MKAFVHIDTVDTPVKWYMAKFNLKRLLKMKNLPNKYFPWLTREEIMEIEMHADILYKKIRKYMGI